MFPNLILFFIITQHKHRLRNDIDISILYTTAILILILFFKVIVGNYYLTIIVHVLVRLSTSTPCFLLFFLMFLYRILKSLIDC